MPAQSLLPPKNDDSTTIELEVVRPDSRQSPGRPAILDPRRFIRICRQIQAGSSTVDACLTEGVTYRRFRQLCASRPLYQKRYEKSERLRFDVRRERMEALVIRHAEQSWQAAIAWLERNLPEKWALKAFVRDTDDIERQPLLNRISLEELIANTKLAAEIASNPPPGLIAQEPASPAGEAAGS